MIGLPGEEVQIVDGSVVIYNSQFPDGFTLEEPYLTNGIKTYGLTDAKIKLADNEYYVLGDNRNASKDSRSFGPVNQDFITGKVLLRGWPFDRITVFEGQPYFYPAQTTN